MSYEDPQSSQDPTQTDDMRYIHRRANGKWQVQIPSPTGRGRLTQTFTLLKDAINWRNYQLIDGIFAEDRHPQHEEIIAAYSSWADKGMAILEISQAFDMTPTEMTQYLKRHKITRNSPPFSDETIDSKNVNELASLLRERKVMDATRIEREKEQRELKADAYRWRDFHNSVIEALTTGFRHIAATYTVPQVAVSRTARPPLAVYASTADLHYGKYAWDRETGHQYNRELARIHLMTLTDELVWEAALFGKPQQVILTIGGDDLHVDTYNGTTTKGTLMDLDGTTAEIVEGYAALIVEWIDKWRSLGAPVDILVTPGNHNVVLAHALGLMVAAYYRDTNVKVSTSPMMRKYAAVGDTLLMFTHGEKGNIRDLHAHMAHEAAHLWGNSKKRVVFTQHLHQYEQADKMGVLFFRHPSISGVDRWHSNSLYATATRGASAYIIRERSIHTLTANL
jgi:hypothetical protein